jgi:hypothetical protein
MDSAPANIDSANRAQVPADEILVCLFQPDPRLSDPKLDGFRRHVPFEPERQFMLALLEDAIKTFQDNPGAAGGKNRRLLEEAEEGIFGADRDGVSSFASVGRALGVDPNDVTKDSIRGDTLTVTRVQINPLVAPTQ